MGNPPPSNDPPDEDNDEVVTEPIMPGLENGNNDTPDPDLDENEIIESLNQQSNSAEVKSRIEELIPMVGSVIVEHGSEFFTDEEYPESEYIREDLEPRPSGIKFGPVYSNSIVRLHMHHNPLLEPVFSDEDVMGFARFYKNKKDLGASDAVNVSSILASNLGIHSLRVVNRQKAQLFAQRLINSTFEKTFKSLYTNKVQNFSKDQCNCSENTIEYQEELLQNLKRFLEEQDIGLAIFSTSQGNSGTFEWYKL